MKLDDPKQIGAGGKGRVWHQDGEVEMWGGVGCSALDEDSDESESIEGDADADQDLDDSDARFRLEVDDIVKGGIADGTKISNIVLEIRSSLKPAYDKSFGECACAILGPLLDVTFHPESSNSFLETMAKWKSLFEPFVTDDEAQIDLVYELQEYSDSHRVAPKHFQTILKALYDEDLVEEDTILRWEKQADEAESKYVDGCQQLLNWLKEASEDEESSEEED